VKRRGQRRAAQERGRFALTQHRDAQPRLDRNEVLDAEPCRKPRYAVQQRSSTCCPLSIQ
jgi:hypothetical protein